MAQAPSRREGDNTTGIDYLVVGHVVVDRVAEKRVLLGGTATYAALTARNFGARVGVHTSASYEPGLVDTLYGTMVARIPAEFTTCFVNEYPEGAPRKQTVESVAEPLQYEQLLPEWRNPKVVHLAPIMQEVDASWAERFPRSLIGVTPQGWLRELDQDGVVHPTEWAAVDRVLAKADVLILSDQDVADPAVLEQWAQKAKLMVVTRAERGCDVYKQGEAPYHSVAYKPARETDPTGAGDVFAAAYLWHLAQSNDWRQAADWANCVASFVVEKRGPASVPKLEDVEKRWKSGTRLEPSARR